MNTVLELPRLGSLDAQALVDHLRTRRWYGAKDREVVSVELADTALLAAAPPLVLALVVLRFDTGTEQQYQLLLGPPDGAGDLPVQETGASPVLARLLDDAGPTGTSVPAEHGAVEFRTIRRIGRDTIVDVTPLAVEQSNTSFVAGGALIVKLYRHVEAGANPELEMLLFLTEHGFEHVPELCGWYSYAGERLDATLGVSQRYLADARDGWSFAQAAVTDDAEGFLPHLGRLGEVVGTLHGLLASDAEDAAFAPEDPTPETQAMITARIEEQVDETFAALPERDEFAELRARADDVRDRVRSFAQLPAGGRAIRIHGDLHLGQFLHADDDWYVIDFEGEPARSIAERRRKAQPLRDVAGVLRSLAYLVTTVGAERLPPEWEPRAREVFLTSYRDAALSSGVLVPDVGLQTRVLEMFELEKALYELRYELRHRPDWVAVPTAGILRLLAEAPA